MSGHFWELIKRHYGYSNDQPGLQDFVIELFKTCFLTEVDVVRHELVRKIIVAYDRYYQDYPELEEE